MDFSTLFIVTALVFSAFVKGSLGMGFSTICLAILANFIDLKTAISIVLIPSLVSNLVIMITSGHWRLSIRTFWPMLLMALPGMLLGLQLLKTRNNTLSLLVLSLVLIGYGIWGLRNHDFRIRDQHIPLLNPIIGLLTGTVNGATGSQIFPIMPYLLSLNISKDLMVQTINMSFTLCSLVMLAGLFSINALNFTSMLAYSLGVIPVMISVIIGNRVRAHLTDRRFRFAVMLLIIFLGGIMLLRQISPLVLA